MRQLVICKNCGMKWVRVIAFYDAELTEDLTYNCPACASNWFEPLVEEVNDESA